MRLAYLVSKPRYSRRAACNRFILSEEKEKRWAYGGFPSRGCLLTISPCVCKSQVEDDGFLILCCLQPSRWPCLLCRKILASTEASLACWSHSQVSMYQAASPRETNTGSFGCVSVAVPQADGSMSPAVARYTEHWLT